MAKETRDVKQYLVHTLYEVVNVKVGEEDGKDITREERRPVAVFDDIDLLDAYVVSQKTTEEGFTFTVGNDWVEFEPAQERFGLPLNPSRSVAEGENEESTNGDN